MKFMKTAAVLAAAVLAVSYFPIKNHFTNAETTDDEAEIIDAMITGYEGDADDPQTFRVITADTQPSQPVARSGGQKASALTHNEKFSDCVMMDGIDVSKHNIVNKGPIDWNAVKADGIDFAIARIGYRGYDGGKISADGYFDENVQGALNAGLDVGAYFFTQAITVQEAIEEANYCISCLKPYNIKLPVYFDVEKTENAGANGRLNRSGLSIAQRTAIAEAFCETIEAAGYDAGIYSSKNYYLTYLDPDYLSTKYHMWLANYASVTYYKGDYHIWQYSDGGTVNGITGNVDMNVLYSKKVDFAETSLIIESPDTPVQPTVTGEGVLSFSSSDPSVATVDASGTITGISSGTSVITVTSDNGSVDTLTVTVDFPTYTGLKYNGMIFNSVGESTIVCRGEMMLTTSDVSVVSVAEDGSATAVGKGRATLTAEDADGNVYTCNVLVSDSEPISGDCNLDGVINAIDAVYILDLASQLGLDGAETNFSDAYLNLYDFNGDGIINSLDASDVLVKSAYAGVGIDYQVK